MTVKCRAVLIRYGEIGIKSERTRARYERVLVENIAAMLGFHGISCADIKRERGRIKVYTDEDNAREIAMVAAKVFGVTSSSPSVITGADPESMARVASDLAADVMGEGETFGIRSRRAGVHDFSSQDMAIKAGDAVLERLKDKNVKVNLRNPDHEIHLEARQSNAYVFTEIFRGAGGLPLGTQEKMVALISGGIDSPVASWLMMKRGCEITAIYLDNLPYTDETTKKRAFDCINRLKTWCPGHELKTYEVPHGENLREFKEKGKKLTCVLCKRMMYRIAKEVAIHENALGIITGSSLGQVASQTASNLYVENHALDFPVYHPLIGYDKMEVADLARKIDTFELSIQKASGCSAVPEYPSTHAKLEEVLEVEKQIDIEALVKASIKNATVH